MGDSHLRKVNQELKNKTSKKCQNLNKTVCSPIQTSPIIFAGSVETRVWTFCDYNYSVGARGRQFWQMPFREKLYHETLHPARPDFSDSEWDHAIFLLIWYFVFLGKKSASLNQVLQYQQLQTWILNTSLQLETFTVTSREEEFSLISSLILFSTLWGSHLVSRRHLLETIKCFEKKLFLATWNHLFNFMHKHN